MNLHRRHLNEPQRSMVAAKMAGLKPGQHTTRSCGAKDRSGAQPIGGAAIADAARLLKVGTTSVTRARKVLKDGIPELVAAVERGEVAASLQIAPAAVFVPSEGSGGITRAPARPLRAAPRSATGSGVARGTAQGATRLCGACGAFWAGRSAWVQCRAR